MSRLTITSSRFTKSGESVGWVASYSHQLAHDSQAYIVLDG